VGTTYTLLVVLKGASVSIQVSGAFGVSWGFNSDVVDGRFGTFVGGATATFDDFRIRSSALLGGGSAPPPPPPGLPSASVGDAKVTEGGVGASNTAVVQVTLSAPAVGGESIRWATADGNAKASIDYMAASGTITFVAGQTTATIVVSIIGDSLVEGDETFTITLSDPAGLTLGRATATVTILDDDQPPAPASPSVSFTTSTAQVTEGNRNWTYTVKVRLSAASSSPVTVRVATSDGTAIAGQDYQAVNQLLTFKAGVTELTVSITIIGDRVGEPTESFFLTLSDPTGATLGTHPAMAITILDDDAFSSTTKKLTAAYAPASPTGVRLTQAELDTVAAAATQLWVAAGADPRMLATVRFTIGELEGLTLAETRGRTIVVDPTAAGHGWHTGIVTAPAADRMDLLTVLLHELGHVLGYDHHVDGLGDLMHETLTPGTRLELGPMEPATTVPGHPPVEVPAAAVLATAPARTVLHGGDVTPQTSMAPPAGPATPGLPGVRPSVAPLGAGLPGDLGSRPADDLGVGVGVGRALGVEQQHPGLFVEVERLTRLRILERREQPR
jgi:hypothetical protein